VKREDYNVDITLREERLLRHGDINIEKGALPFRKVTSGNTVKRGDGKRPLQRKKKKGKKGLSFPLMKRGKKDHGLKADPAIKKHKRKEEERDDDIDYIPVQRSTRLKDRKPRPNAGSCRNRAGRKGLSLSPREKGPPEFQMRTDTVWGEKKKTQRRTVGDLRPGRKEKERPSPTSSSVPKEKKLLGASIRGQPRGKKAREDPLADVLHRGKGKRP